MAEQQNHHNSNKPPQDEIDHTFNQGSLDFIQGDERERNAAENFCSWQIRSITE
jgi:hypothetical protein